MIDWEKLKPYENAKWKSFEELCYQIAQRQFSNLGEFTPVDDSGGGDGVEFYLTLPNGDEWGWQAKFYYPKPRLNDSNRKNSINNSLRKSIETHPNLKKWFLCIPSNFTPPENNWFRESLKKLAPNIELEHWGKTKFNDFLSKPEFIGIKNYFFSELELDIDWFSSQVKKQIFNVKEKFIAPLHTETDADFKIHCLLADLEFIEFIKGNLKKIECELENILENKKEFEKINLNPIPADLQTKILKALNNLDECQKEIIPHIKNFLTLIEDGFIEKALDFELKNNGKRRKEIDNLRDYSDSIYYLIQESPKEQKDSILNIQNKLKKLLDCSAEFESVFSNIEIAIDYFKKSEINIFGEAEIGKTHIACYLCEGKVKNNSPAILLLGRDFTKDKNIEKKILEILDIPIQYSWYDFLSALESMAEAYRTRIPIVIDALNESETTDIWKNQLPGFTESLKKYPRIILINTCRTRYTDYIWGKKPQNNIYIYGFNETNLEEAVNRHFNYYKIKADLTLVSLNQFKHPIYLKLFCEINNPERKEEKQVYIGEQTLYKVIEEYLAKCNEKISCKLSKPPNLNIIQDTLKKIAKILWINKLRYLDYSDAIQLIDEKSLSELVWNHSFTKALLDEGLLISRTIFDKKEKVGFVYDLLGGYLIAKSLLEEQSINTIENLVKSKEFEENLLNDDRTKLHPLFEDILRSVCVLLPEKFGKHLYELTKNNRAVSFSIHSLFEIEPKLIDKNSVELLIKLFGISKNRKMLLRLFESTALHVSHPFNANFLDELLRNLPMAERDFSWTEFVRANSSEFKAEINKFEKICRTNKYFSEILRQRLYLTAQYFSWLLSSTNRRLRSLATKSIYWFGRKYPEKLFELTEKSLTINDPYVPERMLAASYGVAMALHNDLNNLNFRKNILPKFAKNLYKLMFEEKAPYSTTHILMRDYARHTIEIALLHNGELLKEDQKKRIRPPFKDGGIRRWGSEKDRNEDEYRDFNYPFGFDFDNYTIGRLIPNRENYDSENPEYIKVKSNMWWRIYNLGYSLEQFGEIDKVIARYNYPFGRSDNGGKIDRYGKKYCWIAFYEIAGYRKDKGLLKEKWTEPEERISDTDIDPSFPEKPQEAKIIEKYYLEGDSEDLAEWIEKGPIPDISDYLNINKIGNIAGPWVLLNGFISQENYETKRGIFIFLRGFLIKEKDIEKFNKYREKIAVEGRRLPESEEDYYTFEGEIPWCETFPYTKYPEEIEIPTGKKIHKKAPIDKSVMPILLKIGDEVTKIGGYSEEELVKGYSEFDEEVVKKFDVEIPIRSFHYVVNEGQSVYVISKEISTELDLHIEPQYFNMLDNKCKKASIVLQLGDSWHNGKDLIYLRKDLLEKYLKEKNKKLVWIIWGERDFKSKHNEGLKEFSEKHKHYKIYGPYFSVFKV